MCDFFPTQRKIIEQQDLTDKDFLLMLNSHGIFPAPSEGEEEFRKRILQEYDYTENINSQKDRIILWQSSNGKDKLEADEKNRIDRELFAPAYELTRKLYGFAADYVQGFYLFEKVGLLWGGCSIYDDETQMKVFLLRPAFKKKNRFLIYDRTELIAHEQCHCARQILHDHAIEEYFAYQTAKSPLRRYIGNCFIKESDALLFLLPALLLPAAQVIKNFIWHPLPILPFWIFPAAMISYFLIRNQKSRNIIKKARKKLLTLASNPDAILFRSTLAELKILGNSFDEYYSQLSPMRKIIINAYLNADTETTS